MGEFSFTVRSQTSLNLSESQSRPHQAPDTGDAVYKLTYTADMDGFQAMGDHLPVPVFSHWGFFLMISVQIQVIMDPVPEPELPAMVDYTPEVFISYP